MLFSGLVGTIAMETSLRSENTSMTLSDMTRMTVSRKSVFSNGDFESDLTLSSSPRPHVLPKVVTGVIPTISSKAYIVR